MVCRRTPRDSIPILPNRTLSLKEQELLTQQLQEQGLEENTLFIEPDAWMKCFPEFKDADPDLVRDEIIKRVRNEERRLTKERERPLLGVHALRLQSMRRKYHAKKHSKRMICLSSQKSSRVSYLRWYRELSAIAKRVTHCWRKGDFLISFPPGFFAPSGVLYANLYRAFVPLG